MDDTSPSALADWCAQLVRAAPAGAGGAGAGAACEVAAWSGVTSRVHHAGGGTVASTGEATEMAVRLWRDGAAGWAGGTVSGRAGALALVEQARARLRDAPAPDPVGPPGRDVAGSPGSPASAEGGARLPAGEEVVADLLTRLAGAGVPAHAVLWERRAGARAVCNSRGVRRAAPLVSEHVTVRSETPFGAVVDGAAPPSDAAVAGLAGRVRAARGVARAGGAEPPPGLPLLLRPAVSAHSLAPLAGLLLGDGPLARPGAPRRLSSEMLTVAVPANGPHGGEPWFDDEGVTRSRAVLVRHGRVVGFLDTTRSALVAGREPGGCAFRAAPGGPLLARARGLRLLPAGEVEPAERVELVTAFESLGPADAAGVPTFEVGGLLVRDGEPVAHLGRLTARIDPLRLLREVVAVGADATARRPDEAFAAPSLLVRGGVDLARSGIGGS